MSSRNPSPFAHHASTTPSPSAVATSSRDPYALDKSNNDESTSSFFSIDPDFLSVNVIDHGDSSQSAPHSRRATPSPLHIATCTDASSNLETTQHRRQNQTQSQRQNQDPTPSSSPLHHLPFLNPAAFDDSHKDVASDLHTARLAVPYENLTAIDWIHEYARERTRKRQLHSTRRVREGLGGWRDRVFGDLREVLDEGVPWVVLGGTGVAVGVVAAAIDVSVEWLADLRNGVCGAGNGGSWWLNRGFCCWGYEELDQCPDWRNWSAVLHITNKSGGWIVDGVFYLLASVLFASVAAVLVTRYSTHAKQSGIPEIKTVLGGFVIRRFMGVWTLVIKSLGLCLAVASGLVLGKEGPLVHVACCCANLFMKPFDSLNRNEARKREVLSAAAASGISVAFGAPVGGVLFSLEQLSYYFPDKTMWQSFVCAMIAAFTLKAFNPFRTGKVVQYQVTFHTGWHGFEILPFIVIGILGGLYGGLFIKLNMKLASLRNHASYPLKNRPVLEVAIVAALTAMTTFPITFLRAQATELDYYLFAECIDLTTDPLGLCKSGIANTGVIFLLLVSSILAFFFASLTFGLSIPAGILLPSMTIGALYGRVVGLVMEVWQRQHPSWIVFASCEPDVPCITPGTYAIIGAASALAGATRMTVAIVVIMFELTGALTYVLPIMIAVMIAKWVGDAIGKRGIYDAWIHFHGYPFLDHRDESSVPDVPVAQIMTRYEDLVVLTASGHSVASLRGLLAANKYRGFPVVDTQSEASLLGYISRTELAYALDLATGTRGLKDSSPCFFRAGGGGHDNGLDLRPWMDQTPITLNAATGFQLVVTMFQRLGLRYLIFLHRGAVRGLLTKKDVWFVVNEDEVVGGGDVDGGAGEGGARRGGGRGVLREDGVGEERGLLGRAGRGLGISGDGHQEEDEDEDLELVEAGKIERGILYAQSEGGVM